MYRFQWLYMPLIYAIFTLRWVFYRDFKDVMSERIGGVDNRPYPKLEVVKMVFFKLSYVALMVVLPWQVWHVIWHGGAGVCHPAILCQLDHDRGAFELPH